MKLHHLIMFVIVLVLQSCSSRYELDEISPDADPNNLPDLLGTYVINGIDPLGDEYGGHLTITLAEEPGKYHFQWIVVGGIQEGVGVLKGNQLLIEWHSIEGVEEASGSATFTITETGQLYGIRISNKLEGIGREQAFPNQ